MAYFDGNSFLSSLNDILQVSEQGIMKSGSEPVVKKVMVLK